MNCANTPADRGVLTYLDASGASISALCAVHCALMPVLVTLLPILGVGFLADEWVEIALLTLSASLGLVSMCLGYPLHRSRRAAGLLAAGLCLLAAGRVAEGGGCEPLGMSAIVGGGLIVAASHATSRRPCRACREGRGAIEDSMATRSSPTSLDACRSSPSL